MDNENNDSVVKYTYRHGAVYTHYEIPQTKMYDFSSEIDTDSFFFHQINDICRNLTSDSYKYTTLDQFIDSFVITNDLSYTVKMMNYFGMINNVITDLALKEIRECRVDVHHNLKKLDIKCIKN